MSTTPINPRLQNGCTVSFGFPQPAPMRMSTPGAPTVAFDAGKIVASDASSYKGAYEVTPADERQVLPTKGLLMADDVHVAPIPSNYGLITWNGSTLTVS